MLELSVPLKLILSFLLGAAIGLEREVDEKRTPDRQSNSTAIVGLRSFSLSAIFGCVVGLLYFIAQPLSLLLGAIFLILLLLFYVFDTYYSKDPGITTELALIYSFLIGLCIALNALPAQIIVAITVVIILLLSKKEQIKIAVSDIKKAEVGAFVSFGIIALVILPFLPNQGYSISNFPEFVTLLHNLNININPLLNLEIVNPFRLWMIVVLITGVQIIGYMMEKVIDKKGWLIASAVGGFVSSTSTTVSLANQSKKSSYTNHLIAAAVLSNIISFVQAGILVTPLNSLYAAKIWPNIAGMTLVGIIIVIFCLRSKEKMSGDIIKADSNKVFSLGFAIKFSFLFLAISLVSKILLQTFGDSGFLFASAVGSIIGIDAVMINNAQLAGSSISYPTAISAFVIGNAVNLLAKSFYSFIQGNEKFAAKFFISMGTIIVTSIAILIV